MNKKLSPYYVSQRLLLYIVVTPVSHIIRKTATDVDKMNILLVAIIKVYLHIKDGHFSYSFLILFFETRKRLSFKTNAYM